MRNWQHLKSYTHSIMFHHFHGAGHQKGQGSISEDDFEEMIDWLSERYNLLSASLYMRRLEQGALEKDDVCLSFDDALLCQAEIAVPILNRRNIQAFFFVYSSPLVGDPDPLEIYRYFRNVEFSDIDQFYTEFFRVARALYAFKIDASEKAYEASEYLKAYPFYTENDKWFRFLRDEVLGKESYDKVMSSLITSHGFDCSKAASKLWMNDGHIKKLSNDGHVVGLHSYSHPTAIHKLSAEQQEAEYIKNFEHLYSILGYKPSAMSHPCGNYNYDTLEILKKLGIKIGFRSSNSIKNIRSPLEIPRDDHANVMKEMKR